MAAAIIEITLDGKKILVEPGTRILEAAESQGIRIPTLCHDRRLEPYASCWVCLVKVERAKGFVPSCGTRVAPGMVISTSAPEVLAARKMALELLLSNHYGDCKAPCTLACPSNIDIQGYLGLAANGKFPEAIALIRRDNPMPAVIGRVCPRPCETPCRRNLVDEPLNIKFLGQNVEIVKVTANEVTFRSGTSHYLFEGQSFTVDDKTVTLDFVSENGRVSVTVDGETKVLQEFDHEVIGGLDVRVENILVNSRSGSATLVVGQGVLVTQKNDDNYMDDSQFRFEITTDGSGNLTGLSVIYDEVRETLSDDVKPLALGESLTFPNSFLSVKFDKVLYTDYFTYDVSFKTFNHRLKDGTPINVPSVLLRASSDKGIEVASDNVGEIYIDASNNVYYQDNQGDWLQDSTANTQLVNNDFIVTVAVVGGQLQFATAYSETITADTDFVNKQLGPTQRESEPVDVSYNAAQFGTRDKDVLLASGIVLVNPDTNSGNDRVSFKLPSDRVEAELFISQ